MGSCLLLEGSEKCCSLPWCMPWASKVGDHLVPAVLFICGRDFGALALHPDGPASPGVLLSCMQPGFGAGGEESVNPAFLGEVTAVCSEEENALLCSWAGRGQP